MYKHVEIQHFQRQVCPNEEFWWKCFQVLQSKEFLVIISIISNFTSSPASSAIISKTFFVLWQIFKSRENVKIQNMFSFIPSAIDMNLAILMFIWCRHEHFGPNITFGTTFEIDTEILKHYLGFRIYQEGKIGIIPIMLMYEIWTHLEICGVQKKLVVCSRCLWKSFMKSFNWPTPHLFEILCSKKDGHAYM